MDHLSAKATTDLLELDPATGQMKALLKLPSGGDTSYPGLLFHDDVLWVGYYSSHEEQTCIYMARVRLV